MNKTQLIASVADKANITKKAACSAVSAVSASITDALAHGDKVTLVVFGTSELRERAARQDVNPSTKQPITIPATKVPAFKPGKSLKEVVAPK